MTIMATKGKAPRWVMVVTLLIIAMFSVMRILNWCGIVPFESVSIYNEHGETTTISYNPYGYILNIISILIFLIIGGWSIVKKWSPLILLGTVLLIIGDGMEFCDFATLYSYRVLLDSFGLWSVDIIMAALYLIGYIMIFSNSNVFHPIKITAIVFVILFAILGFIPICNNTVYLIIDILKAVLAIALCFLCYSKSSKL